MPLVKTVEMRVLADAGDAQAKLDALDAKAKDLDGNAIKMRFRLDDGEGKAQLDKIKAKADELGFKDVNIKVRVDGAGRAIAELEAVKREASGFSGLGPKTLGGGGPAWLGPALLAVPAIAALGGVTAGAAAGLAGAFAAGAGALAAFGAVAKPVLSDALKASQAVEKAQNNYNAAIAGGAKPAAAYKAEQTAIAKAYAELSPAQIALSKQLGGMSQAWQNLKATQTPVVAGALQPWLKSVTDLTRNLAPIIAHVSPVIRDLGVQFDKLIGSSAFRGFRDFIASTGTAVVSASGGALINFLKGFTVLLPQFDPLIREAAAAITRFGTAFASWAGSQKASDQIQGFLRWFSQNGPAVGGLLKNIGGALKNILPGLSAGGMTELNVISGFFGLIAKLPPGLARPLAELAGVLLTLNKLGVVSVGLKLAGMDAAALAASGGAAGLWGKLLPGVRLAGGALVAVVAVDMILKNTSSGKGKNWFDNPFGMPGPNDKASANNWLTSFSPYERFFSSLKSGAALAARNVVSAFDGIRHGIASKFDGIRHDIAAKFDGAGGWLAGKAHDIAHAFDTVRHDIAAKFDGVKGFVVSKFNDAKSWLVNVGHAIVQGLADGIRNAGSLVSDAISVLAGLIPGWAKKILHISSPSQVMRLIGQQTGAGLVLGLQDSAPGVGMAARNLAGAVTGASGTPGTAMTAYGRGALGLEVHFHGVVGDPQAVGRQIVQVLQQYKRGGGGAALGIA